MKWLKNRISLKMASILALFPVVSWSSTACTQDEYGCPPYTEDDESCCRSYADNETYSKMCMEAADSYNRHIFRHGEGCSASKDECYDFNQKVVQPIIEKCGNLAEDGSNTTEWRSCLDAEANK